MRNASVPVGPKPTLVVVGAARTLGDKWKSTIPGTIRRLSHRFEIVKLIVFENDSEDDTLAALRTWPSLLEPLPVEIVVEHDVKGFRTERIARARNELLDRVAALEPAPAFMLAIDLDGVNSDLEGVETCLELPAGWGGW